MATQRIHVLQLTGDPVGGIRKHVHSILTGLDPAVFQQSYAWSSVSCDKRFQAELNDLRPSLGFAAGLPIRKKPHPSDLANLLQLVRLIRRHRVDIVHGHGAKGGVYARALHLLCGVKAVYTPHGGSVHPLFPKWEKRLYGLVERVLLPLTNCFVFESNYTAAAYQALVGRWPRHWTVNYNGVQPADLQQLQLQTGALDYAADARVKIGVFAMLRTIKGQRFAIDAVRILKEKGQPVVLHLFGDGADRQALMQQCVNGGVEQQVVFHGDVADVLPHMNAMDIVLIPSLHESFGYVAVEALSIGKYTIASRTGGLTEVIAEGDDGALGEPGNSASIAEAVVAWCRQRQQEALAARPPAALHRFRLDTMLANLTDIYRAVASGNRLPLPSGQALPLSRVE